MCTYISTAKKQVKLAKKPAADEFLFYIALRLSSFTDSFKLVQRTFRNESITLLEINLVPNLLNHVT